MSLGWIVLGVSAVWRMTHMLQAEDGPWDLSLRVRRAAGSSFFGRLLDCFHCLSLWMALPVALLMKPGWRQGLLLWLGLSGGAILIERTTVPSTPFKEDPSEEESDVLLRKAEAAARPGPGSNEA